MLIHVRPLEQFLVCDQHYMTQLLLLFLFTIIPIINSEVPLTTPSTGSTFIQVRKASQGKVHQTRIQESQIRCININFCCDTEPSRFAFPDLICTQHYRGKPMLHNEGAYIDCLLLLWKETCWPILKGCRCPCSKGKGILKQRERRFLSTWLKKLKPSLKQKDPLSNTLAPDFPHSP